MAADPVDPAAVAARLTAPVAGPVLWANEVTSTNDLLAARARRGAPEGVVMGADHQTAGRGRRGRVWEDGAGQALLFSVLLRPPMPPAGAGLLPIVAAVGAAEGLAAHGVPVRIGWPNDLLLGDRKLAGILCEIAAGPDRVDWAVIGIGINVAAAPRLTGGRWRPAAVADVAGAGASRGDLLVAVLTALSARVAAWYAGDTTGVLAAFAGMDALAGRPVTVGAPDGEVTGTGAGLAEDGALRVVLPDGSERRLTGGEVTGVDGAA
ncbi:MAG: biotin--[acetyl-CoA-carboxylase] ligase [Thermoleophilia bacterium]|nr:biotin--[acetyl-CoA-carboxylase] ligase [Thermoleophilia bacterium]